MATQATITGSLVVASGAITGTFGEADGTIQGTVGAFVLGTLTGSVGIPGPAGSPGVISATSPLSLSSGVLSIDLSGYYPTTNPAGYQTASQVSSYVATNPLGALLASNNLSDVGNPGTAATNLGLGIGSDVTFKSLELGTGSDHGSIDKLGVTFQRASDSGIASFDIGDGFFQQKTISGNPRYLYLGVDSGLDLSGLASGKGVVFQDSTTQTTAFIPSNWSPISRALPSGGTVNQALFKASSTNYDTTWRTVDIYSTTSSTTLTVAKTTQTLTVGTYLGYTPLQDVTIAATADPLNQHMHGQVVSYSQTTGVMVVDVQSKTGSGTYSAWTVNIGGIGTNVVPPDGATGKVLGKASATDYDLAWVTRLDPANNLSDLANAGTARTNLGLGTAATRPDSYFAQTANNLSDLANASTARTNLGLGSAALLASSAVAQTANNLSDLANSSTARTNLGLGAAAVADFATDAQARNGLLTNVVANPYGVISAMMDPGYRPNIVWNTTTSGTGAAATGASTGTYVQLVSPNASTAGYAIAYSSQFMALSAGYSNTILRFDKPLRFGGTIDCFSASWVGDANNEMKVWVGQTNAIPPTNSSDPTLPAIGWKKTGGASSTFTLFAHDGTTLYTQSSSATLDGTGKVTTWEIRSDGAGNVALYINGTIVATLSTGPTTAQSNICTIQAAVGQTASAVTRLILDTTYLKLWVAPQ